MRKRINATLICSTDNKENLITFTPFYQKRKYLELLLFSDIVASQINLKYLTK